MAQNLMLEGYFGTLSPIIESGQNGQYQHRTFDLDITDNPQYPNVADIKLKGKNINIANQVSKGTKIEVHFHLNFIRGQKKDGSGEYCITELVCWKIGIPNVTYLTSSGTTNEAVNKNNTPVQESKPVEDETAKEQTISPTGGDSSNNDDLPF